MHKRFGEDEFLRAIIEEAAEPLRLEMNIFRSVDHVVRCFDSVLFKLRDMNVLNECSVRMLINILGQDFAPYVVLMGEYADFIRSQRPRFNIINEYLSIIEEASEVYKEKGIKAPDLPLGFNRPAPDALRHEDYGEPHLIDIRWKEPSRKVSKTCRATNLTSKGCREEAHPVSRYYEEKSRRSIKKIAILTLFSFLILLTVLAPYVLPSNLVPSWWPKLLPSSVAGVARTSTSTIPTSLTVPPHSSVERGTQSSSSHSQLPPRSSPPSPPLTGFALMYPLITLKEVNKAGDIVFGGSPPINKEVAIWKILSWVDKHIRYDYSKASASIVIYNPDSEEVPKYQSPLRTINKGTGICADYAILISSLLVYAGIDSYILVIDSSTLRHAAAVAVVDNTPFVLEQHPPPIEFQDYYEYMLGSLSLVRDSTLYHVVRKDGKLALREVRIPQSWLRDSYPEDYTPESLAYDVLRAAETLSNKRIIPDAGLKSLIACNYSAIQLSPRIGLAGLEYVNTINFYSPALKHVYALYYAEYLVEFLSQLNASRIYAYVSFTKGKFVVAYAYTPAPEVRLERRNGYVQIEIHFKEPVKEVAILYYNPRNDYSIAGVLPKGWHYKDIWTITALRWEYTPMYLKAMWVEPSDLRNTCIGVIVDGEALYASCHQSSES